MATRHKDSSYFLWRYIIMQPAYIIYVMIITTCFPFVNSVAEDFFIFFTRLGLVLLGSLVMFIFEASLKKKYGIVIFRTHKEAGETIITQLIRGLILAGAVVGILSFLVSGSTDPVGLEHGFLSINLYYILVYFIVYLVTTILVSILTKY